jgi:methyl-accepting chemotaxis protein
MAGRGVSMKNLKIGTKLFIGFGIGSLLLIVCSSTGMFALTYSAGHLADVQAVDTVRSDVSSILTYAASISDAIKALALTDDAAERQKLLDGIGEIRKAYKAKLEAIAKNAGTAEGKKLFSKLQEGLGTGKATNQKMIESAMKGDRTAFIEIYKNEGKFAFERVRDAGKDLDGYYNTLAATHTDEAVRSGKEAKLILLVFSVVALVVRFIISFFFSAAITRPIRSCVDIANRVSDGDLNVSIESSGKDETALLMRAMHNMVSHMKETIGALSRASMEVSSAAAELHMTSHGMVTGAEEVVAQSNSAATAGEEMAATSSDIANSCHMTAQNADSANKAALEGAQVVKRSIAAMETIADRVKSAARTVDSLGGRSEQIGEIIGTIEDIADQTNLLALNAAIEAARAGEQGRGFAVVADEVRALAERTTKATREIGEMIKTIQNETRAAVSAMDDGVSEVEKGTGEVAKSGQALEAILEQIGAVTQQANQIATAAEEQTATTSEISQNMQRITEIVQHSAHGAKETDLAASQLTKLAEELQRIVGRFRLAA